MFPGRLLLQSYSSSSILIISNYCPSTTTTTSLFSIIMHRFAANVVYTTSCNIIKKKSRWEALWNADWWCVLDSCVTFQFFCPSSLYYTLVVVVVGGGGVLWDRTLNWISAQEAPRGEIRIGEAGRGTVTSVTVTHRKSISFFFFFFILFTLFLLYSPFLIMRIGRW